MGEVWMCEHLRFPTSWSSFGLPSVCFVWLKLSCLILHANFQPNSFFPVVFVGDIDLYSFLPLSLALTLQKLKLLTSFFLHTLAGQDKICCSVETIHVEQPDNDLNEILVIKKNVLLETASKKL